MPSRAARARAERALRVVALGALGALAVGAALGPRARGREVASTASVLDWVLRQQAETLAVRSAGAPDAATRDLLVALRRNGSVVEWSTAARPGALELEPIASPAGGVIARVAAGAGTAVRIGDALGPVGDAVVEQAGATFRMAEPAGRVWVAAGADTIARAAGSAAVGDVVVLGSAGWEARFVMAALEVSGWRVSARLGLAPGLWFTQRSPLPLDTGRHAAVIVLDSTAEDVGPAVRRFVLAGGGLVIAGEMNGAQALAPGAFGAPVRPEAFAVGADRPLEAVPYRPVTLRYDGLPLEHALGGVTIAARRAGAGRVVQVGYEDTWRWRMTGEGDAPRAHASWWSNLVSQVARRTITQGPERATAAPYAEAVAALGPPAATRVGGSGRRLALWPWLLTLGLTALFVEWASRRLRGAA